MKQFKLIQDDPYLKPHEGFFTAIHQQVNEVEKRITGGNRSLRQFADGHEYFGLHFRDGKWVFREWAPNASAIYLIGPFCNWQKSADYQLKQIDHGNWEVVLPAEALHHYDIYKLRVEWPGGGGERVPAYTRRCVQDHNSKDFSAQVWKPEEEYCWKNLDFKRKDEPLLIYETHVGMAQEEEKVGSYGEFRERVLPRIVKAGYNTIQIMAILEHPYYGSFGYQVSSFFAPSFRFGTPEELKELIDAAHAEGLTVLLDLVHSHAVRNENEGLGCLDGTTHQYFHMGARGFHPIWDSRLFNYSRTEVLRFLLSNVRYWIEEYQLDGFRFDGVTSMLYHDHGLKATFGNYDSYFGDNTDRDALTYLTLVNKLLHSLDREVITIAEDVSGLPGLASSIEQGGFGFDYRLSMGIPDYWTKTVSKLQDQDWHVGNMYWTLTNRRVDEKTISYAESHDQALVGDKTLIFWLLDAEMYYRMRCDQRNHLIDRGLALHRLIRFITITTAANGYLNFMGNEFGHPEWIDFPREGNGWSYRYARRLWSLVDNPDLQYQKLANFDREMIELVKGYRIFDDAWPYKYYEHCEQQVLFYKRGPLYFIFNFSPDQSYVDYVLSVPPGAYQLLFDSDADRFGGNNRILPEQRYISTPVVEPDGTEWHQIKVYLPTRSALVLKLEVS